MLKDKVKDKVKDKITKKLTSTINLGKAVAKALLLPYLVAVNKVLFGYLFNLLWLFLDVGLNTIIGGHRTETISSRCGKGMLAGKKVHTLLGKVIDKHALILFREKDHCINNIIYEDDTTSVSSMWNRYKPK